MDAGSQPSRGTRPLLQPPERALLHTLLRAALAYSLKFPGTATFNECVRANLLPASAAFYCQVPAWIDVVCQMKGNVVQALGMGSWAVSQPSPCLSPVPSVS